ncbi:MAG TPA: cytochrome c [Burkholderiales bacterium]|nr:cytochrome c [Burkholderiales bacterium]
MKPLILMALAVACGAPMAASADDKDSDAIKKLFAKNCALCHFNYGLDPGRGAPKLAGTQLSLKGVYDRIANGKQGVMPGFKKLLTEQEIQALADYIKALPAN